MDWWSGPFKGPFKGSDPLKPPHTLALPVDIFAVLDQRDLDDRRCQSVDDAVGAYPIGSKVGQFAFELLPSNWIVGQFPDAIGDTRFDPVFKPLEVFACPRTEVNVSWLCHAAAL